MQTPAVARHPQAYQRCGVGSRLLAEAIRHAKRTRCRCIYLHVHEINSVAQHIYARAGFQCQLRLQNYYKFRCDPE